ncbi:hypothetical protein, partial [Kibdelosporangium philippinense]|uniref:hypothetical protein n=1 Tax=Kibdelosporangium philippinense TaxID=211113 RepID=UPI003617633A
RHRQTLILHNRGERTAPSAGRSTSPATYPLYSQQSRHFAAQAPARPPTGANRNATLKLGRSGRSIPLYAIADTEPIPTTSSKQATKYSDAERAHNAAISLKSRSQRPGTANGTATATSTRQTSEHLQQNKLVTVFHALIGPAKRLRTIQTVLVAMLARQGLLHSGSGSKTYRGTVVLDQTVPAEQFPDEIEILMGTVAHEDLPIGFSPVRHSSCATTDFC